MRTFSLIIQGHFLPAGRSHGLLQLVLLAKLQSQQTRGDHGAATACIANGAFSRQGHLWSPLIYDSPTHSFLQFCKVCLVFRVWKYLWLICYLLVEVLKCCDQWPKPNRSAQSSHIVQDGVERMHRDSIIIVCKVHDRQSRMKWRPIFWRKTCQFSKQMSRAPGNVTAGDANLALADSEQEHFIRLPKWNWIPFSCARCYIIPKTKSDACTAVWWNSNNRPRGSLQIICWSTVWGGWLHLPKSCTNQGSRGW